MAPKKATGPTTDDRDGEAKPIALADLSPMESGVLDALPAGIALLDHQGTIAYINRAWADFALESGGLCPDDVIGLNYLDAGFWYGNPEHPSDDAVRARAGIRAVIGGDVGQFVLDYPCHTQAREYWLELRATPLHLDQGLGARPSAQGQAMISTLTAATKA